MQRKSAGRNHRASGAEKKAQSVLRERTRGRLTSTDERQSLVSPIHEARQNSSRLDNACHEAESNFRTYRRWYQIGEIQEDQRPKATRPKPVNKLSKQERQLIVEVINAPEYACLSPSQIVPILLDKGEYIASESSFYRVLKEEGQLKRRGRQHSRKKSSRPISYTATGPNQVFTWDITYMPSRVRGQH